VNDILHTVFSVALIAATLTYLTPILFASIGGAITQQGDILNIGLEGMMLIGAFSAIAVGAAANNALVGVLAAVASSLLLSLIYAVFTLWLKADFIVVGIGVNMLAAGASVFALQLLYGNPGGTPQSVRSSLPKFTIPILGQQTPWCTSRCCACPCTRSCCTAPGTASTCAPSVRIFQPPSPPASTRRASS